MQVHALIEDGSHGKVERIQTFHCQACRTSCIASKLRPTELEKRSLRYAKTCTWRQPVACLGVSRLRRRTCALWLWLAIDPISKITLVLHLGLRTQSGVKS